LSITLTSTRGIATTTSVPERLERCDPVSYDRIWASLRAERNVASGPLVVDTPTPVESVSKSSKHVG
jgi:hypothetical protein